MQRPWGRSMSGIFLEEQESQCGKTRGQREAGNEGREVVRSQILPCFVGELKALGFHSAQDGKLSKGLEQESVTGHYCKYCVQTDWRRGKRS